MIRALLSRLGIRRASGASVPLARSETAKDDAAAEQIQKLRLERLDGVDDEALRIALEEMRYEWHEEEGRRARVEGKATSLLAAVGLAVSLGSGMLFASVRAEFVTAEAKWATIVGVAAAFAALVCLGIAGWYALRALSRSKYHTLGPEDVFRVHPVCTTTLRRQCVAEYAKCAIRNRATTNAKVDDVRTAQRCVRLALALLLLVALVSLVSLLLVPIKKAQPGIQCPSAMPSDSG